jgi:hypothetical protein
MEAHKYFQSIVGILARGKPKINALLWWNYWIISTKTLARAQAGEAPNFIYRSPNTIWGCDPDFSMGPATFN